MLGAGGLVAFPTDTVYGVACAAAREDRLPALFALKRRRVDRRIPLLIGSLADVRAHQVPDAASTLAARFWPGPLTMVLPASDPGAPTQAYRVPDHPVALDLIRAAGPLFATSANLSDEPDTLDADEVLIAFATQADDLDAVIDGGPVYGGQASTVVDLSTIPARILRTGPVSAAELAVLVPLA